MDASTYGERVAHRYDDDHRFLAADTDRAVGVLAELAAPGSRALELGVGTGRLAIPLAQCGVAVTGIDSSAAMLARLAAKPGGGAVRTVVGDMADVAVDGAYDLIFVVFNTFFALPTQEAQIACFASSADRLVAGGKMLVEAFVPDHTHFDQGQVWRTIAVSETAVVAEASRHEPISQRVDTNVLYFNHGEQIEIVPIRYRYAHVAELDLMARHAGLELRDRWATWTKQTFGPGARQHISVYHRSE